MKKPPYPDKKITSLNALRKHIESLVFNTIAWLKLDGYAFYVILPKEQMHHEAPESGATVNLEYPYKKFKISIQQDSVDKMIGSKLNEPIWENIEQCIFHEIIHIILWEVVEIGRNRFTSSRELVDAEEYAVDHLTHVIYPLIEKSRKK